MRSARFPALAAIALLAQLLPVLAQQPTAAAGDPQPAAAAAVRPATLEDLMQTMATTPGVVAEFTETKRLALLDAPLETRGTLYFIPPGRMARHTTFPGKSALIIDGDRLVFDDEAGGENIDLAANPIARVFVENFIVLFNGDLAELQRRYIPRFTIDGDHWSLELEPRRAPLSGLIDSIVLRGDESGMRAMVLREVGGDATETTFTNLDAAHQFAEDEIARLFRAEPAKP